MGQVTFKFSCKYVLIMRTPKVKMPVEYLFDDEMPVIINKEDCWAL